MSRRELGEPDSPRPVPPPLPPPLPPLRFRSRPVVVLTHPDPDPLDATDRCPFVFRTGSRCHLAAGHDTGPDRTWHTGTRPPTADEAARLPRFREQRRRSRWGCSVALVALTLACLVFWAAVLFVAVNVLAAPSAAPEIDLAPLPLAVGIQGQRGAPYPISRQVGAGIETRLWPRPGGPEPGSPAAGARSDLDRSGRKLVPIPPGEQYGAPLSTLTYTGVINYAEPSLGRFYLAIPNGPGWRVRICGPAGCLDRTSTDAGPDLAMQRAGRIADLNSIDWQQISGVPLRYGGFQGTVLVLGRARTSLPETDMEGP